MPPTQPHCLEAAGHLAKQGCQKNAQVLKQTRAGIFYGCWKHLILRHRASETQNISLNAEQNSCVSLFISVLLNATFILFYCYYFIYLFSAALGLCCCTQALSSCGKRGPLFVAMRGPLITAASLVAEHGL